MNRDRRNTEFETSQPSPSVQSCPHCGVALSPWQQVLLAVDRALVCKKCWYRIILEDEEKTDKGGKESSSPTEG